MKHDFLRGKILQSKCTKLDVRGLEPHSDLILILTKCRSFAQPHSPSGLVSSCTNKGIELL